MLYVLWSLYWRMGSFQIDFMFRIFQLFLSALWCGTLHKNRPLVALDMVADSEMRAKTTFKI